MAINQRTGDVPISSGPYLAIVTNHLDTTYMGGLEVTVLKPIPGKREAKASNVPVRYCSPFFGTTSARFEGNNSADYKDAQKSYGFWAVPPDVGSTVMVMFVAGDINQGYWFGGVPSDNIYQNYMTPGLAASQYSTISPADESKYGTKLLPVAEYHKASRDMKVPNPDAFTKPIHPFADRLLQQGLLLDTIRGVTSSSARREAPSAVFGISTPGPIDQSVNAPRKNIGYDETGSVRIPVNRLGGSTFVMDDGDKDGQNELIRIRTRTGHQILLHNSSDLIYIGNSKGTAWIELTSNGKMDVYCEDSISMRTKGDFNLRADRDFNIEAGRNFNVAVKKDMNVNVDEKYSTICDEMLTQISGDFDLSTLGKFNTSVSGEHNLLVGGASKYSAKAKLSIGAGANLAIQSASQVGISGPEIRNTAGRIELNGPSADVADAASPAATPVALNLYSVPQRDGNVGWSNGNFYKTNNLVTIMQRVPSHEPWDQHENINPAQFTLEKTSTAIQPATTTANGVVIPADPSANTPYPAKNGPASDRGTLKNQTFSWSTDQPFLTKIKEVAGALKFDPLDLIAIINLESARTFDPYIQNNLGYTGLIQFGNDAAKGLGTTTAALREMGRVQQMDYVYRYFNKLWGWPNAKCPNPTLVNLYLTVLLPAFRFSAPDEKIADASNPKSAGWYNANKGFDPSRLGYFTPAMVEKTVTLHRREIEQVLAKAKVGADLVVPAA